MIRCHPFILVLAGLLSYSLAHTQPVSLTFKVDMSMETLSPNGVHVAGNFQEEAGFGNDWTPNATMLSDMDGDEIYEVTVMVPAGTYQYKFINGNSWGEKPELPSADCAINDGGGNFNRQVTVGSQELSITVVQFDSCNARLQLAVNMNMETISSEGVHVMGNFQEAAGYPANWAPDAIPMEDSNDDGVYEVSIQVPPGTYEYVFVNGNTAVEAEAPPSECAETGGNGNPVRTKTVEVGDSSPGLVYCFNSCTICDPSLSTDYETYWWNDAVFYEIFVRSFYDSDGDGIGDFQGIIEKLDYLNDGDPETDTDLGITGIWLMPMMESPSYHGYDVTNYYATQPDYGSMQDFEELLDEAHARGIKIIIDFVMNHCSNQHPWFQQSINSQNGYRDWFRWSDNHPGYNGPWGQPVWHSSNGGFYYGLFWDGMPDLNYSHPPVKEELFDIAEFWLDKGIDGFRLDAIKYLDEDGSILENTPETFQILEDFHQLYKTNNPDALTVGEVWSNTASIIPYIQNDRLDVCFDFDLAYGIISAVNGQNPGPVEGQLQVIQNSYPRLQYATFLTNHDINRIYSQLGSDSEKMKLAASIYLTLPGIPFVYYGEEVGMTGTGAHENIRRPMQWSDGSSAGFSTASPWISLGSNYTSNNVEGMENNPTSLLNQYKKLIHIRNDQATLRKGYLLNTEGNAGNLLSYARIYEEEAVIIAANTGTQAIQPELSLSISTLPPGEYFVTELLSESNWGTLTINSDGGFENWYPNNEALEGRQTHVILLSQEQMGNSTSASSSQLGAELFPNPASGAVTLRLTESSDLNKHLQILTSNGQWIREQSFDNSYVEIDIADLATGLYFIKVQLENGEGQVLRLVVEH